MNITIFVLLTFFIQFICFFLGTKSTKKLLSQDDYFIAGKKTALFPLMMTFLATQIGGGLFLGSAEEAYKYGWSILLYPIGQSMGFILLGLGLGKKLSECNISTIAELFEVRYRFPFLRRVASLLSIFSLFFILVAQIIASHKFMVSIGFDKEIYFFIFWTIVITYTVMGGLNAVIVTDMIQASFFVGAFLLAIAFVLLYSPISFYEVVTSGLHRESFSFSPNLFYGWLFMPMLFTVVEQDMGQRCFAAKSPKIVSKATIGSAMLMIFICCIPIFMGILAKQTGIDGEGILMLSVIKHTSPWMAAIIGCAILCAIISTADSLLNAISSNLCQDFSFLQNKKIKFSQMITTAVALLAFITSYYCNNIVPLMIQSYALSVSSLFVPVIFALIKKEVDPLSAFFSILLGTFSFVVLSFYSLLLPKEVISLIFSFGGYLSGSFVTNLKHRLAR